MDEQYSCTGSLLLGEPEYRENKERRTKQVVVKYLRCEGFRTPSGSGSGGSRGNGEETPVLLLMSIKTDHYTFYCPSTFISGAGAHNLL